MNFEVLLLEQPEPGIYRITVNRPKALNALNSALIGELGAAIEVIGQDRDARALLITGAGEKAFVAGADIVQMSQFTAIEGQTFSERALDVMRRLELLPIPVIAAVNGYALGGGCELALACDFILASERAVFGQPEVNLGIAPGFGGTQRLPRRIGTAMALELILSGRQVKAEEAKAIGLVNHVYPAHELMAQALELAKLIASKAPIAVRYAKQLVQRGQDLDLANACALESDVFGLLCSTADKAEGMRAFVEKRAAQFRNE
jgi:enoyl-CoA hydratase